MADGHKPILLQTNEMLEGRLHYIHQNPVEAELVDEPDYYWYSSARDYAGGKGILDLARNPFNDRKQTAMYPLLIGGV